MHQSGFRRFCYYCKVKFTSQLEFREHIERIHAGPSTLPTPLIDRASSAIVDVATAAVSTATAPASAAAAAAVPVAMAIETITDPDGARGTSAVDAVIAEGAASGGDQPAEGAVPPPVDEAPLVVVECAANGFVQIRCIVCNYRTTARAKMVVRRPVRGVLCGTLTPHAISYAT